MSSPEGAGYGLFFSRVQELFMDYGIRISDGYFPPYIYSAPSELKSVEGLTTSGFTGGYSYIAPMRLEIPLGQSICIKINNNTMSPTRPLELMRCV
jgi:hypothetical protein